VEKDWVIAHTHVRGGGEKGVKWHLDGKLENKPNSFYDFLASVEFLVSEKITHPNLLVAKGVSAGGLLVGHCVNMKPEYFRAAVLKVPFLDPMILQDESIPLSVTDHLEFGNPKVKKFERLIKSYSPYENIQPAEYPSMLIEVSTDDP